jgi:LmbE family N-acetylglucosaminyl deacetylase
MRNNHLEGVVMEKLIGIPDLYSARRILAVQPHYDDNDIAAGGTLAALSRNGAELFYLTVTDDLVGVIDQSLSEGEMTRQLRAEQSRAGNEIGVSEHFWLGFPDAGKNDYYYLRKDIIKHIRLLRPDFIFTCDPWTPYEAHQDHILTGRATAEAATLFGLERIKTDPQVDADFMPFELVGVVFYASGYPNTLFDISGTHEVKHRAVDCYRAQFKDDDMAMLKIFLDYKEQEYALQSDFSHGEPLKVLQPMHLHVYPDAWRT